jgi:endonuclease III
MGNLSKSELQEAHQGYEETARDLRERTYDELESHWQEEQHMLENFPRDFEENSWDRKNLEATTKWKWAGLWANHASASENTDEKINRLINEAVSESDPAESVEVLKELRGVADATATVLLTFAKPKEYTVMDVNALAALREFDVFDGSDEANSEEYPEYLDSVKGISEEFDMTLREVDRALWKLGEGLD